MDVAKELSKRSDIKLKNVLRFIVSVSICELAGIIGALFTSPAIPTWYIDLVKPKFEPPVWIFGPVWVFLYLIMGIALFIVWKRGIKGTEIFKPIFFFSLQLVFNVVWTIVFFGLRNPGAAISVIAVLWVLIIYTMIQFFRIRRVAAYLLIPYILWVSFAFLLNYSIWQLNYS